MPSLYNVLGSHVHRVSTRVGARLAVQKLRRTGNSGAVERALGRYLASSNKDPDFNLIERERDSHQESKHVVRYQDLGNGNGNRLNGTQVENGSRMVSREVRDVSLSSAPAHEGRLLFSLVSEQKPAVGLELGTCLGISAAYQALAMSQNGSGRLVTIEGGSDLSVLARQTIDNLGMKNVDIRNGSFSNVLTQLLPVVDKIDYAFIDGHHNGNATVEYFEMIKPHLRSGSVVLFDDLSWSADMRKAWNKIKTDTEVAYYVDLFTIGICVTS